MSAAEANPFVDQFMKAVDEAESDPVVRGNVVVYKDEKIGAILDRLANDPGAQLRAYEDGSEPEVGLRMEPCLRTLARPGVGFRLPWGIPVRHLVEQIVPAPDLDLCDRCERQRRPAVSLCVPASPSIWVFRICDPCVDEMSENGFGKLAVVPCSEDAQER